MYSKQEVQCVPSSSNALQPDKSNSYSRLVNGAPLPQPWLRF